MEVDNGEPGGWAKELAYLKERLPTEDVGGQPRPTMSIQTSRLRSYCNGLRLTLEKERQQWHEPVYSHQVCVLNLLAEIIAELEKK